MPIDNIIPDLRGITASFNELIGGTAAVLSTIDGDPSDDAPAEIPQDNVTGTDLNEGLWGGPGNSVLVGLGGNDRMNGNDGNDTLLGGAGNDSMYGGAGDDLLLGESGDDIIFGNYGSNIIFGGDGNDSLHDGDGDDLIDGGNGNGNGNDTISASVGNDTLIGGDGNDWIDDLQGNDELIGGGGNDTFRFQSDFGWNRILDFTKGEDKINLIYIDASSYPGIQDFTFIGNAFLANPGDLGIYFDHERNYTYVEGDFNGDGAYDFSIRLNGIIELTEDDFIL
ncbi:MAG: calcium-binding protein [Paracoccus sp. (in: a-proteobacteria)]